MCIVTFSGQTECGVVAVFLRKRPGEKKEGQTECGVVAVFLLLRKRPGEKKVLQVQDERLEAQEGEGHKKVIKEGLVSLILIYLLEVYGNTPRLWVTNVDY